MKIIAVMSPKGGIGKTTTSDSIAYMLGEEQGKRVLVLDGDPQGDTSKTFGVYEPDGIGMSELLEKHECVGGTYKTGDLIRPTEYSHVDIIPANGYLMKTDMNLLLKSEDNQVTRLREALEEVADAYDYCICDCGRLLDMVVINILIATELIIAPVKVGGYEIEALQNLEEQIEDLRDINPDLRIKALMTMRQKNKTSLEVEEWLKAESGFDMFVTPIRRSIIAEKSTTAMIPLPKFSKRGIVSQDYRCVVHELLKEMEGQDMKEHDWVKLYADADKFMKKVGGTDFNVKTNIKTERWGEALVTVDIPKRNNPIAIMRMDANEYCSRCKGFRRDGKLYLTYMLRIEKINAED